MHEFGVGGHGSKTSVRLFFLDRENPNAAHLAVDGLALFDM